MIPTVYRVHANECGTFNVLHYKIQKMDAGGDAKAESKGGQMSLCCTQEPGGIDGM